MIKILHLYIHPIDMYALHSILAQPATHLLTFHLFLSIASKNTKAIYMCILILTENKANNLLVLCIILKIQKHI